MQDTIALRDNPQELDIQIAAARAQLEAAQHQIAAAQWRVKAMELARDASEDLLKYMERGITIDMGPLGSQVIYPKTDEIWKEYGMTTNEWWSSWVDLNMAVAAGEGAQRALDNLLDKKQRPLEADMAVAKAQAAYDTAEKAVEIARAQLRALQAGATEEQLDAARSQVKEAQAAVSAVQAKLDKLKLKAPISGTVLQRTINEGEIAAPGATLFLLGNLDEVTLTIYVTEEDLGKVQVGQAVRVKVDSYPNEIFPGRVVQISSEAEFMPKNVQTKEERIKMVFAVKVRIPNPEHKLRAGMPADAIIQVGSWTAKVEAS